MKCKKCGNEFEGKFCSNCGTKIETQINENNSTTTNNTETKKPFYKKKWFIIVAIVLALIVIVNVLNGEDSPKKVDWSELELSEHLPEPEKFRGDVTTNRSDLIMFDVAKLSKKEYKAYVEKCIDAGYNIDLEFETWDNVYGAFNNEGYSLRITYLENSEEMGVTLKTPEKLTMKEFEWPSTGLGAMLPTPKSNFGDISWNTSETFIVDVGNTTIDDFNNYVKACEDKGFTIDYSKSEKSFSAKNFEGYKVHLMYLGANVVEISLKLPEGKTITNTSSTENTNPTEENKTETQKPAETSESDNSNTEISKQFKDAMDSYEEVMNEYITFMKKYKNSNGTDPSLIADYAKYLDKYTQACKDFAKWEDAEMNTAEASYYLDVQTRVNKKLLEVAY